jgi:putative ABC transport system ATP-binding protein
VIEFKKLSKVFTTDTIETTALNKIDFLVNKGDFVAVMGPSGSGKSTLLNIAGMLDTPTGGAYLFDGIDVTHLNERELTKIRHQNIGFIFQSFNLIDELTVRENVELPLMYQKISATERKKRSDEVLTRLNIFNRADHMPQQLSGGQQQRVAVARALIIKPKLILADEPTGNLDSSNGTEVMRLLSELNNEGTTILMVTHSLDHSMYASRIFTVKDGEVYEKLNEAAKIA